MPLVTRLEIISVVPCLADTMRIRVTAQLDADIGDVLPYLNLARQSRAALSNGIPSSPGSDEFENVQRCYSPQAAALGWLPGQAIVP